MTRITLIFTLLLSLLLASCFKEDERVAPYIPGDVNTALVVMMEDYRYQSFFSLRNGKVIDSLYKYDWDLALTTKDDDYTLYPNTSLFMKVAHTGKLNFDSTYVVNDNTIWEFDSSDGDSTGNAIGRWWLTPDSSLVEKGEVLLIDRGIDFDGLPLGYLKIQPSFNPGNQNVQIKLAKLDGTEERTFEFNKLANLPFVTMSFTTGFNSPQPFPPSDQWELWFTQYTTLLYTDEGDAYPYLVTGALINKEFITVALDTVNPFNEVNREIAETISFTDQLDVIGYDWKKINGDVTSGDITYIPRNNYVYIIRTSAGYYYKLRFIDFYNNEGKKGYPKFEYQLL
jgi:hypothetical protein